MEVPGGQSGGRGSFQNMLGLYPSLTGCHGGRSFFSIAFSWLGTLPEYRLKARGDHGWRLSASVNLPALQSKVANTWWKQARL